MACLSPQKKKKTWWVQGIMSSCSKHSIQHPDTQLSADLKHFALSRTVHYLKKAEEDPVHEMSSLKISAL